MYIDLIIKIKNARWAGKESLKSRYSKMDYSIAETLARYGFIKKVEVKGRAPKKIIDISLDDSREIHGVKFISTPSLKRYIGYSKLKSVKSGNGISVISTSKGIKSNVEAKKDRVGGQLLFEIW